MTSSCGATPADLLTASSIASDFPTCMCRDGNVQSLILFFHLSLDKRWRHYVFLRHHFIISEDILIFQKIQSIIIITNMYIFCIVFVLIFFSSPKKIKNRIDLNYTPGSIEIYCPECTILCKKQFLIVQI